MGHNDKTYRYVVKRGKPKDFPQSAEELLRYLRFQPQKGRRVPELNENDVLYWCDNKPKTIKTIRYRSLVARAKTIRFSDSQDLRRQVERDFSPLSEEEIQALKNEPQPGDCCAVVFRVKDISVTEAPMPDSIPPRFKGGQGNAGWLRERAKNGDDYPDVTAWMNEADRHASPVEMLRSPMEAAAATLETAGAYTLAQKDSREFALQAIALRHRQFRSDLIEADGGSCAVTGCSTIDVLEAAHIERYLGPSSNHVQNGLLLRADIHTLFDLDLIRIDPETMTLVVDPSVTDDFYRALHGRELRPRANANHAPSKAAIQKRWSGL